MEITVSKSAEMHEKLRKNVKRKIFSVKHKNAFSIVNGRNNITILALRIDQKMVFHVTLVNNGICLGSRTCFMHYFFVNKKFWVNPG